MPEPLSPPNNPEVSFEASDAQMGPIIAIGVGIILLGLLAHVVCLWMFDALRASTNRHDPELPALAAEKRPRFPEDLGKVRAPRLQVAEGKDLTAFRQQEDERLQTYGWIDPKTRKVHIPIEEAMRLLANPDFAKAHGIQVAPAKNQPKGGKG